MTSITSHVTAGIEEKWWRQHMRNLMVVLRASNLEPRIKRLGQTEMLIPGNGNVFPTLLPCSRRWLDMFRLILQGENLSFDIAVRSSDDDA